MTYVKQLEDYEEAVMAKRLAEMPAEELERLLAEVPSPPDAKHDHLQLPPCKLAYNHSQDNHSENGKDAFTCIDVSETESHEPLG